MPQVIVNVSMPNELKKAIDRMVASGWYTSASELIRDGARKVIKTTPKITVNGFTEEFEEEALKAAAEPIDEGLVWESEKDVHNFFKKLKKKHKG